MTQVFFLAPAGLSVVFLVAARAPVALRERIVRWGAWAGVVLGGALFVARDGLAPWRALDFAPEEAAIVGVALACTWGSVIALDLGENRWWAGALAGVASTGLVGVAAARWTIPVLLFLVCGSAALCLAAERSGRATWLSFAAADGAIAATLIADVVAREAWSAPETLEPLLLAPLLVACALRAGLVVRLGASGLVGTPAAVLGPIAVAGALVPIARWVERPLPWVAGCVLLLAVTVAAWSVLRRSFDPSVAGAWPVGLGAGLLLMSERATTPAAVAAVLGMTVVCLWPDALERGRLSRGVVLSGLVPTVTFGAVGIAARESFARATAGGEPVEVAAWLFVSGLLPVAFATGVAVGLFAARTEPKGGYHPEAVFLTWVALAASAVVGFALGPGKVYGALGGGPAAGMFAAALVFGALAAIRTTSGAEAEPSARVVVGAPPRLGGWAGVVALALHALGAAAIAWITILGLQQGFL